MSLPTGQNRENHLEQFLELLLLLQLELLLRLPLVLPLPLPLLLQLELKLKLGLGLLLELPLKLGLRLGLGLKRFLDLRLCLRLGKVILVGHVEGVGLGGRDVLCAGLGFFFDFNGPGLLCGCLVSTEVEQVAHMRAGLPSGYKGLTRDRATADPAGHRIRYVKRVSKVCQSKGWPAMANCPAMAGHFHGVSSEFEVTQEIIEVDAHLFHAFRHLATLHFTLQFERLL